MLKIESRAALRQVCGFAACALSIAAAMPLAATAADQPGTVAQSTARELGPQGIHVAHLVIDSGVDTAWVRERMRQAAGDGPMPDRVLMRPAAVAEAYWALHQQPKDAWTFEQEIRPAGEPW